MLRPRRKNAAPPSAAATAAVLLQALEPASTGCTSTRTWPTNSLRGAMALSLVWLPAAARRGLAKWHTSGRPLPLSSGVVPFTLSMARSASAQRLNWTCARVAGGSMHSMQDESNRRIKPKATERPVCRRKSTNCHLQPCSNVAEHRVGQCGSAAGHAGAARNLAASHPQRTMQQPRDLWSGPRTRLTFSISP